MIFGKTHSQVAESVLDEKASGAIGFSKFAFVPTKINTNQKVWLERYWTITSVVTIDISDDVRIDKLDTPYRTRLGDSLAPPVPLIYRRSVENSHWTFTPSKDSNDAVLVDVYLKELGSSPLMNKLRETIRIKE